LTEDVSKLLASIEYQFNDKRLLKLALTHRSAGRDNNERLEFLGDAVLGMVIAEALYKKFPKASEGDLSRLRANLVRGETLAVMAADLQLGDYLTLGPGELKSGGFRRHSILADAFEAVLGAIYLDSDFNTCQEYILNQFSARLKSVSPTTVTKDPKTRLQEYLQSRRVALPNYEIKKTAGEAHAQTFTVECRVKGFDTVIASESSRRKAEQLAAAKILELIEKND